MAKEHGDKLRPAVEAPGTLPGAMFVDRLFELQPRKKLEQLGEDAPGSLHWESLLFVFVLNCSTRLLQRTPNFYFQPIPEKLIWTRSDFLQKNLNLR